VTSDIEYSGPATPPLGAKVPQTCPLAARVTALERWQNILSTALDHMGRHAGREDMDGTALALAVEHDLDRAGFTEAERAAFDVAIGKPGDRLTNAEQALLLRYEAVASWGTAA